MSSICYVSESVASTGPDWSSLIAFKEFNKLAAGPISGPAETAASDGQVMLSGSNQELGNNTRTTTLADMAHNTGGVIESGTLHQRN